MVAGILPVSGASAGQAAASACATGTSQVKATSDIHTAIFCVVNVVCTEPGQRQFAVTWSAGHSADEPATVSGVVNAELGKTSPGKTKSATATSTFTSNTASGSITVSWPPDSNGAYPDVNLRLTGVSNPCPAVPTTTTATTTTQAPTTTVVATTTTPVATTVAVTTTAGTTPVTSPPTEPPTSVATVQAPVTTVAAPTVTVQALSPTVPASVAQIALPQTGARQNTAMMVVGLTAVLCGLALLGTSRRRSPA